MPSSSPRPLAVVGGGIGGLAAALAAARAGRTVTLVERAAQFGEIGAGLQLAPNASLALDELGVLADVQRNAVMPPRLVMMDAVSGTEVSSLDLRSSAYTERFRHPYMVTHRTDLHAALLAACRAEPLITLCTGLTVIHAEQDNDHVRLFFEEQDEALLADAVIAADGLHSRLRRALTGEGDPVCSRYVAFRGAIPTERMTGRMSQAAADEAVMVWAGPAMHLVQYPVRRGELYNQVAVFRSDSYTLDSDDWGTEAELEQRFAGACDAVRDALPLVARDRRWPLYDRPPLKQWAYGRIALLGDAAHPMLQYLAQGACQALEDATALGRALREQPDASDAFTAYAARRTERAGRIQTSAHLFGDLCHLEGMGATMRNLALAHRSPADFDDIAWVWIPAPDTVAAPATATAASIGAPA